MRNAPVETGPTIHCWLWPCLASRQYKNTWCR